MALKVVISHKTKYKYDKKISLSPHIIRLRPAPHSRTPIEAYSLKIKPENNFFNWQQDPFGNYLARLVFPEKTDEFEIDVEIIANMKVINPFDFFVDKYAEDFPFVYDKILKKELLPYLEIIEDGEKLNEFFKNVDVSKKRIIDFLVQINQMIYKHLSYTIRLEPGIQTCEETLIKKNGSCRDFAWLLVQLLRKLGLAARFVSGYLVQLTADEKSLDGPSGPEKDFTDLHAWTEVYIPGAGWIGLDSTSGLFAGEGHIPLACTPNPESAAPVTGLADPSKVEFEFSNEVTRIFESPRVTKPYKEETWNEIYNLGFVVDKELEANDVRLTMGGEPTFVSIDDMESAQWNTQADGSHKRELANNLSRRLLSTFGEGGFLHHAQGKWYPGEALPRWQITAYWRKDKKPIWNNVELLANNNKDYGFTTESAKKYMNSLCRYLGIRVKNIKPAYEDPIYFIWEEQNFPLDLDPLECDLKDPLMRQKISENLSVGLDEPRGYVLPINWDKNRWVTSQWEFRRKNLFLIPGNSAIGMRLPLKSLIVKSEVELEKEFEPDLFASFTNLSDYHSTAQKRAKDFDNNKIFGSSGAYVRTAIVTEARGGKLYVFLPPLENTEAYLDLLASIEECSNELNMPVIIEGYEPPTDLRIEKLRVTPDPGVIEVNVHPSKNWDELTQTTLKLYHEAKLSRLGTEKFMLDGKHTGTGGGNHVTLGGLIPSDSPLLRNPTLLRSLVTFWQHHPGLSYLFSGAFVGPTSQAPRIDEGRIENLYEMEIAFSQIPEGEEVPFWLTDRLFRNLLTDITGNTHRSEFCIDKLYSPDSSSGRLGILELRAFDMPPHKEMSLMQMLLVRTLVSLFWRKPYKHKLVRWGTELHDRFLLEHYVKEDIKDIVELLNNEGYPFKLEWFDPFFEFRFPLYGMVDIEKIHLELRMAIEPWNVLGEEVSGSGTSRYVDSSIERVQIKVTNFVNERYIISCNGVKVPLVSTGVKGEFVTGVRYKAWQPWSALHPTIGVDTPLVFDVVDTWNKRSIGGFTYFVSHPGGRSYDTFPVNSYEAESRRINRFWDTGHTQGEIVNNDIMIDIMQELSQSGNIKKIVINKKPIKVFNFKELPQNEEFPNTLDLRKRWSIG